MENIKVGLRGLTKELKIEDEGVLTHLLIDEKVVATLEREQESVNLALEEVENINFEEGDFKLALIAQFEELIDDKEGVDVVESLERVYSMILISAIQLRDELDERGDGAGFIHFHYDQNGFGTLVGGGIPKEENADFADVEDIYGELLIDEGLILTALEEDVGAGALMLEGDTIRLVKPIIELSEEGIAELISKAFEAISDPFGFSQEEEQVIH